jgi:trans-2,3-dihydro-3-hydroxyanthranilate isomerase
MRAISREFNQSETTFCFARRCPGQIVRLRSFTPIGTEVGGAGHSALGAWLWLVVSGRLPSAGDSPGLRHEIGGQVLPVEVIHEAGRPVAVLMDQSPNLLPPWASPKMIS